MDHDWSFKLGGDVGIRALVRSSVSKVESFRDVKVELESSSQPSTYLVKDMIGGRGANLDSTTLPFSLQGIFKLKVELSTSARVLAHLRIKHSLVKRDLLTLGP